MSLPWSEQDDLKLRIFCRYGWKIADIAEHMGRDYNDVSKRREKLRCYPKRNHRGPGDRLSQTEALDILTRYYDQHQSMATIVRETGISLTSVRRHVNSAVGIWYTQRKRPKKGAKK